MIQQPKTVWTLLYTPVEGWVGLNEQGANSSLVIMTSFPGFSLYFQEIKSIHNVRIIITQSNTIFV